RLPPEQSRSDGPRTRPDERQGGADGREENAGQGILGVSEGEPDPDRRDERAGNGRPQAGEQEATRDDREHRGGHCARRPAVQRGHRPTNECGSADEPQDGEAHAWPAASEGREEPAHNTPTPAYGIDWARATLKGGAPDTLSSRQASVPMMPRFSPMMAACVRSFAPSFERMILTRLLTVSSEIDSCAAICLLALPPAISRSTS